MLNLLSITLILCLLASNFDRIPETTWHPAELVEYDPLRCGEEYKFEWVVGIVWVDEDPRERIFYRSIAQWEAIVAVARLGEEQVRPALILGVRSTSTSASRSGWYGCPHASVL
jgi:hypothetical protein